MPKDRGAEQGVVDGPSECSLALGTIAAETWLHISTRDPADAERLPYPQLSIGADDPRHAVKENGGFADFLAL